MLKMLRSIREGLSIFQLLGIIFLCAFFYIYTVGSVIGQEGAYDKYFAIVIVLALLEWHHAKKAFCQYTRYFRWQGVFLLYVTFSLLYTINENHGVDGVISIFKILVKVTTVAVICKNSVGVKKLLLGVAITGLIVFFTLLRTGAMFVVGRLGDELVGNSNSLGLIMTFYLSAALFFILNGKNKKTKVIFIIIALLDIFVIMLTGGRKFILFTFAFIFSSFLFSSTKLSFKSMITAGIVIIALLPLFYYLITEVELFYNAIGYRLIGLETGDGAEGADDQSAIMRTGIDMFLQRPLFGWGASGFQQYFWINKGDYFYAHSNYVELLADFGIVGTLLYYSQYIYCFRVLLKADKANEERKFYLPLLISIAVMDVFAISFNQTAFIPLLLMFISGSAYRLQIKSKSNHSDYQLYFKDEK